VAALALATQKSFAFAVVDLELERPKRLQGLALVKKLRASHCSMRILAVTEHDSFAGVILALRAGADDLLPKPMGESELVSVLLDPLQALPPVPDTPLEARRRRWEHICRIFEQCDRNISEASRRLGLHRRSLQRILAKRAPRPRGS
jgi:two-component system response regulator RegA